MLALNPALLSQLDDAHLCAALAAEGHLTPAERELAKRLDVLAGQETPEEIEARLEKSYKSPLEQSEFRAQLIELILALCKRPGTKAELVKAISMAVENSYVEL